MFLLSATLASVSPQAATRQVSDRPVGDVWWETVEGPEHLVWRETQEKSERAAPDPGGAVRASAERQDALVMQVIDAGLSTRERTTSNGRTLYMTRKVVSVQLRKLPPLSERQRMQLALAREWVEHTGGIFETLLAWWESLQSRIDIAVLRGLAPLDYGERLQEILDRVRRVDATVNRILEQPADELFDDLAVFQDELVHALEDLGPLARPADVSSLAEAQRERLSRLEQDGGGGAEDARRKEPGKPTWLANLSGQPPSPGAGMASAGAPAGSEKPSWLQVGGIAPPEPAEAQRPPTTSAVPPNTSSPGIPAAPATAASPPAGPVERFVRELNGQKLPWEAEYYGFSELGLCDFVLHVYSVANDEELNAYHIDLRRVGRVQPVTRNPADRNFEIVSIGGPLGEWGRAKDIGRLSRDQLTSIYRLGLNSRDEAVRFHGLFAAAARTCGNPRIE